MRVKQMVSKFLKDKEIELERNELGINFSFEGWNFLLWDDAHDPSLFRLVLPGVFDVTDDNFAKALMACNDINWNFKVVKAVLYDFEDEHDSGSAIWLCFEQVLEGKPQMGELVPNAIHSLLSAADALLKELAEDDS